MVQSSSRPSIFLLAITTMMFSLVLLSATSSGAQTESEDQGKAKAAVGDEECVEFEDKNGGIGGENEATLKSQQDDNEDGADRRRR